MKKTFFYLLIGSLVLSSCNHETYLSKSDNLPELSEKVLELQAEEAISVMQKNGFVYEGEELHKQHPYSYIFSRGAKNAQFSLDDAPERAWLFVDRSWQVDNTFFERQMEDRNSVIKLFKKWSYYTEEHIVPKNIQFWEGMLNFVTTKDDKPYYYSRDYENIADINKFREDLSKSEDVSNLCYGFENYRDFDIPKEIVISFTFEEEGMYILAFQNRNYVNVPMPCLPVHRSKDSKTCDPAD